MYGWMSLVLLNEGRGKGGGKTKRIAWTRDFWWVKSLAERQKRMISLVSQFTAASSRRVPWQFSAAARLMLPTATP